MTSPPPLASSTLSSYAQIAAFHCDLYLFRSPIASLPPPLFMVVYWSQLVFPLLLGMRSPPFFVLDLSPRPALKFVLPPASKLPRFFLNIIISSKFFMSSPPLCHFFRLNPRIFRFSAFRPGLTVPFLLFFIGLPQNVLRIPLSGTPPPPLLFRFPPPPSVYGDFWSFLSLFTPICPCPQRFPTSFEFPLRDFSLCFSHPPPSSLRFESCRGGFCCGFSLPGIIWSIRHYDPGLSYHDFVSTAGELPYRFFLIVFSPFV